VEQDIQFNIHEPALNPAELNDLYTQVGWNNSGQRTTDKTSKMLDASPLYITARAGTQLVGFGRLLSDAYVGQLLDIITHPEYRQRGIARRVT